MRNRWYKVVIDRKGMNSMTVLSGKTAIVTGAAQGIGAVYARALAAVGAKVCLSDILDTAEAVQAIKDDGGEAIGMSTDVTDIAACEAMVANAVSAFGAADIMVTNAALFAALERRSFLEIGGDEWEKVMAINTRGVFNCIKSAAPEMKKRGYGKIINICTSRIFAGLPFYLHYDASKGAVFGMTRAMAKEFGDDGIRVNAIAPGSTMSENVKARTDWRDGGPDAKLAGRSLKRLQDPEDLIGACLYVNTALVQLKKAS